MNLHNKFIKDTKLPDFGRSNPQPLFLDIKRICILYGHTLDSGHFFVVDRM